MNEKKYLRIIKKQLKCSSAKKKEIVRQIQSDIAIAMEHGKSIGDALNEIGNPADVVREFNDSMSNEEIARGKKEKRRKIIGISVGAVFLFILLIILLGYWVLPKTSNISESERFSEEKVTEQAKLIIQYLDNEDFEALKPLMAQVLLRNESAIRDARAALSEDFGNFQSWGKFYIVEAEQLGQHIAVVDVSAVYENVSVTYRLSFNEEMLLVGLYMR